ncbi:hypothetical protein [Pollutimonas sp. M17]|uniref:hypothetical protein n=1 Tax=Pollutimonas sp. M17 TaxID=2962065 RepID=UPI0021F3CF2A|nr:hypothetical protein [Pollutimonas sp. M17]UYO95039.1 hypothetical protein OEG81_06950 [Pollutimonas sp. M17]
MRPETIVTYQDPDGPRIVFDADQLMVTARDADGTTVHIEIGRLGMLELGRAVIRIGQPEGK